MRQVALAVAALLVPAVAANPSTSSTPLSWTSLEATPRVITVLGAQQEATFSLEAAHISVESDHVRMLVAGEVSWGTQEPRTDALEVGASSWRAAQGPAQGSLYVLAEPQARLTAGNGSGSISLPQGDCLAPPSYFARDRDVPCTDLADSLALALSTDWVLQGNFTLVLWEWRGTYAEEGREHAFATGTTATWRAVGDVGEYELRQTFLRATAATLRVSSADSLAFVHDVAAEANLPFAAPQGLHATQADGQLFLSRILPAVAPSGARPDVRAAGLGVLALGSLLVVAGVVQQRRARAYHHLQLASENMRLRNTQAAARHARKAGRHRRYRVEASVVGALAGLEDADAGRAKAFLRRLHAAGQHDEAVCRYLHANLCALQGDPVGAQQLVEDCLALDPSMAHEVAANRSLAPFLDPRAWPGVKA